MSFDVRDFVSPDPRIACDGCGALVHAVAVHSVKIPPASPNGASRWAQWKSCASCEANDRARWDEQKRDEERERMEAQERAKRAAERDTQRTEKRFTGNTRRAS